MTFGLVCVFLGPFCLYPFGGPPPPLKAPNITGIFLLSPFYICITEFFVSDSLSTTMAPTTLKTSFYFASTNTTPFETFPEFPEDCANIPVLYSKKDLIEYTGDF